MTIFIINHSVENCGVYQYGKRFANIISKSTLIKSFYFELNSQESLMTEISRLKPDCIIYNHLSGTMPWVNSETVQSIREIGIKQYLIVHNVAYATFFDYYLHQNPDYLEDESNFSLCRPLFDWKSKINTNDSDTLNIGSFGFGFRVKHFEEICRLVDNQFSNRKVNVNLHLTISHFCPNSNEIQFIKSQCIAELRNPLHRLIMTHEFLSDEEKLNFLSKNDLNIFIYTKYNSYNGISSTVDYALSVRKPIAICKSNMFSHIWDVNPSICVEDNALPSIIENGFTPLYSKYTQWSNENFIEKIEIILKKLPKYV